MRDLGSVLTTPSHCPHCHHRLAWYDLVPLLSYILLRGHCRYCGKPISLQYPVVELALGILAVLLYWEFGVSLSFVIHLVLATALVVLFTYDLTHMILPDAIVLPGIALAIASFFLREGISTASIGNFLLGIVVAAGFLGLLYVLGKGEWLGFGDVKFGILIGALLGWPLSVAALATAFLSGALVSSMLLLAKQRGLRSQVPFGPFLVVGTLSALLWGDKLVDWYSRMFL